ncbi:MAG TPA: undecaprenyldiphospho-muramoylpentapeptide beta-N-acetylglucosaminyltransferase, partial [Gammaproteobacteria bacterium]|nr:undecaprenyldiphospho-muramoylpentapeptide beta-N-acetylglucosaminyltransferase [Gammaproteobacteria bacterium]
MNAPTRILLMAGGTGGHVFPALAVADELRGRGVEVSWLGTRNGLEAEVVPQAGYPIDFIDVSGLRGKRLTSLLTAPFRLLQALTQSLAVMRRRRPAAVLGMGGFVSGPGGLAAWLARRPLLIHEQNARAGLTNRLLRPLASRVMEAFPHTLRGALHTGNPLRSDFLATDFDAVEPHEGVLRLLVVGGSLGAVRLNEVVPEALALLARGKSDSGLVLNTGARVEVWHQAGRRNIEQAREAYAAAGIEARVEPFIDDMAEAYRWADLVLCRSGAMTVAELAAAGTASILVPYPFAVDDHQAANARYLADGGAAVLLPQEALDARRLVQLLQELDGVRLREMGQAARRLALPEATVRVADQCLEVARG